MVSASLPRTRLVLWAALIPLTYAPLYLMTPHVAGWWWLPLLSTGLAAAAVALIVRTDAIDRAAVALQPHAGRLLGLAIVLYALASTLLTRARLNGFGDVSQAGIFGQSYWTLLRGYPFSNTGETVDGTLGSHFGVHFSPLLLVLTPLYALAPDPLTLIAAQAVVAALSIVPLYRLLERDVGEAGGVVLALALLAVPNFWWAGVHDFREASFLPVFLVTAYLALEHKRHGLLVFASLGALGVREEAGLAIMMLGFYALLRAHGWRMGLGLIGLGAVWIVIVVPLMTSLFWTPGLWLDPPRHFESMLGHWGATPLEAAQGMAAHPAQLSGALVNAENGRYLYRVMSPMLVIPPLLDPAWIVGLPVLALNMLSNLGWMRSPGASFSIIPATFFAIAAMRVAVRSSWHAPLARRPGYSVALGVIVLAGALPALPLTARQPEAPAPPREAARAVLRVIPKEAAVYAPLTLYPALCNRERFGCWENLKEEGRRWSLRGRYDWFVLWPDAYPPDDPRDRPLADSLASDPRYEAVPGHEPFVVFRRK